MLSTLGLLGVTNFLRTGSFTELTDRFFDFALIIVGDLLSNPDFLTGLEEVALP